METKFRVPALWGWCPLCWAVWPLAGPAPLVLERCVTPGCPFRFCRCCSPSVLSEPAGKEVSS